jgi:glycine/D-amino acid oxidase-like deaminating enzyme
VITLFGEGFEDRRNELDSLGGPVVFTNGEDAPEPTVALLSRYAGQRINVIIMGDQDQLERIESLFGLAGVEEDKVAVRCVKRHRSETEEAGQTRVSVNFTAPTLSNIESILWDMESTWVDGELQERMSIANVSRAGDLLLVGAGCTNLVAAYRAAKSGYSVTVIDSSPDPRSGAHWSSYGTTMAGMDARMYSLTEVDNYNETGSKIHENMRNVFETPVSEGGWFALSEASVDQETRHWLNTFRSIPPWAAKKYANDLYRLSMASWNLWQDWQSREPRLFEVSGMANGILRTFEDEAPMIASRELQDSYGMLNEFLTPADVYSRYRSLAPARRDDLLTGALEIRGFTVGIHRFCAALLDSLEAMGAELRFGEEVLDLQRGSDASIHTVVTECTTYQPTHLLVSVGATPRHLLSALPGVEWCHAVGGAWREQSVQSPVSRSVKIKRAGHLVEDVNATVVHPQAPSVILGGGYLYTGSNVAAAERAAIRAVADELQAIGQAYYGIDQSAPSEELRVCWRPWTPAGLGTFSVERTHKEGVAIVSGGHNTGGFALSAVVADAIMSTLRGESHPLQRDFLPSRQDLSLR